MAPTAEDIERHLSPGPGKPRGQITDEQKAAVDAFVKHFAEFKIGGEALQEREMMWLETMLRYLRATRGDVAAAIKRLEATVAFRRSLNLYDLDATAAIAEQDTRNGTRFAIGWNRVPSLNLACPVSYVFLNRNPLPLDQRNMVQNVFMLERMMDLTPAGEHEVCTVFNFGGQPAGPKPGLAQTKEMLAAYDTHYPLQPQLTMLQDMGWAMRTFVNMVWPFIGEAKDRTITKTGKQAIAEGQWLPEALIKECGGTLDFTYDHATYWPVLLKKCRENREAFLKNWRALGTPEVGRSEFDWKVVV